MQLLNSNPLDLIEADVVVPPVIELGCTGTGMICHGSGVFQRAAILQISSDPGRSEAVISHSGLNAGRGSSPADHHIGISLGEGRPREFAGSPANRPE